MSQLGEIVINAVNATERWGTNHKSSLNSSLCLVLVFTHWQAEAASWWPQFLWTQPGLSFIVPSQIAEESHNTYMLNMVNTQTVEESLLHSVSSLVYQHNCYAVLLQHLLFELPLSNISFICIFTHTETFNLSYTGCWLHLAEWRFSFDLHTAFGCPIFFLFFF